MRMNEYQELAMRTKGNLKQHENLMNAVLGLNGEAGEVADLVKKSTFQGHLMDIKKIKKELGDILWYVALGCYACGTDLERVANMNIEKLKARYPEGFKAEDSINRDRCCMCDIKLDEHRECDAEGELYCIKCFLGEDDLSRCF